MEDETLPMPRKQKGFQNEIAFFGPGRMEQKEQLQGAA
jgi:hypothetical protein